MYVVPVPILAILLGTLLLSGCNSIEHRSESMPKAPLKNLAANAMDAPVLWTNSKGTGLGNSDAKLELVIAGNDVISVDAKGTLRAQDKKTGRLKWQQATKTPCSSGPSIIDGRILLGMHDGKLRAHSLTNGAFLWQANLTGEPLAAAEGNAGVAYVHTMDGSLAAIRVADGHQLWRYSLGSPPIVLRQSSRPALTKNFVFVGFANGRLAAVHREDGSIEWEREITVPKGRSDIQRMSDVSADPVVSGNVIYVVSYQGRLAAIAVDTGTTIWERELSSYSGLALAGNAIYVNDAKGHVFAFNRQSGQLLWEQKDLSGRKLSKPVVVNDRLYIGDEDGYLHSLALNGEIKGRLRIDSKGIEATPIVNDNALYVLGRGGKIAALSLKKLKREEGI